jgi:hypothetical protein
MYIYVYVCVYVYGYTMGCVHDDEAIIFYFFIEMNRDEYEHGAVSQMNEL